MAELFQATARLIVDLHCVVFIKLRFSVKRAVTLINAMDQNKFPRLLSRVIQKLHLKVNHIIHFGDSMMKY